MSTAMLSQPQGHRVADVLRLLQTAFPKHWKNHLRNYGITGPADLPAAELARFTEHVFWLVKQTGIKDPAAWLVTHRALEKARTAPLVQVEPEASMESAVDISVQLDSIELEPGKLGAAPAKASSPPPPTPVAATPTSRTTKPEPPRLAEAAVSEAMAPKAKINTVEAARPEQGRRGGRQLTKQIPSAEYAKSWRMLTPERMRIILDSLAEYPIFYLAAAKAGIHRKTLEYWIDRSVAGDAGYDVEWQGLEWRFHHHCASALAEAEDKLVAAGWNVTMGRFIYKTDKDGNRVEVGFRGPWTKTHSKILQLLLELKFPDKWGKNPKIEVPHHGGVLIVGDVPNDIPHKANKGPAASVRARKWKAAWRMIRETED